MPRLSDSMTEGTIVRWLKRDGESVVSGEAIVDIETDKATMAFEAQASGTLRLGSAEGESVAVGQPIATIVAGEGGPAAAAQIAIGQPAATDTPPPSDASSATLPTAVPAVSASASMAVTGAPSVGPSADVAPPTGPGPIAGGPATRPGLVATVHPSRPDRLNASPLARRLAGRLGVDLQSVTGSGPYSRILARDVAPRGANGSSATASRGALRLATAATGEVIAFATIFVEIEVAFGRAIELRDQLRTSVQPPPTLDDIIVKALALALREHPRLNSSWRDGRVEVHEHIDVSTAIAVGDDLFAPTITRADSLSLPAIAARSAELAERARTGSLQPSDLAPGTFTVTNLGGFGTTRFTPVLSPPQTASLGVGALHPTQASRRDGATVVSASLGLVCDQRVAHPAQAAMFLESVAELLEAPMRILL